MSDRQSDEEKIRQMLVQLHDELEHAETLNDEELAMMRHLKADIQEMLNREETRGMPRYRPSRSFINRLKLSVDLFELNHPTLTITIDKVLETLSVAGI
jgi:hypothetical protein